MKKIVSVRRRRQLTIPAKIASALSLEAGDLLELETVGRSLRLTPATVIPRAGTPEAEQALSRAREDVRQGRYTTVDDKTSFMRWVEEAREQAASAVTEPEFRASQTLCDEALQLTGGDPARAATVLEEARASLEEAAAGPAVASTALLPND